MTLRGSVPISIACLCLFVGAATPPAAAEDVIILGPGYAATSPVSLPGSDIDPGTSLLVIGRVQEFAGPLADLNGYTSPEYTYALSGLVCGQWWYWYDYYLDVGGRFGEFTDGILSIYRDTSTPARFDDGRTFSDGEKLFEATCSDFVLGTPPAQVLPSLHFTDGFLFERVSTAGTGYRGVLVGDLDESAVPEDMVAMGYRSVYTGTVRVSPPTPVQPATWGRLKTLYGR